MDLDLTHYNQQGLIPGPHEEWETFKKRVDFCLSLKTDGLHQVTVPGSKKTNEAIEKNILLEASQLTKRIYGIDPDWVPVFFSNWQLAPWHGGAAWIFQLEKNSPLGALLQLRKKLYQKPVYLGFYPRDELIAHEMAHVGRCAFEEKKYEELLAYRVSTRGFTRYLGPIVQSASESRLIVIIFATLFLMDGYFMFNGSLEGYMAIQVFKLLPLALILLGLFRLKKRQKTLTKTEQKLTEIVQEKAPWVLYRLTDAEIENFSRKNALEIEKYMKEEPSLRWKAIRSMLNLA